MIAEYLYAGPNKHIALSLSTCLPVPSRDSAILSRMRVEAANRITGKSCIAIPSGIALVYVGEHNFRQFPSCSRVFQINLFLRNDVTHCLTHKERVGRERERIKETDRKNVKKLRKKGVRSQSESLRCREHFYGQTRAVIRQ